MEEYHPEPPQSLHPHSPTNSEHGQEQLDASTVSAKADQKAATSGAASKLRFDDWKKESERLGGILKDLKASSEKRGGSFKQSSEYTKLQQERAFIDERVKTWSQAAAEMKREVDASQERATAVEAENSRLKAKLAETQEKLRKERLEAQKDVAWMSDKMETISRSSSPQLSPPGMMLRSHASDDSDKANDFGSPRPDSPCGRQTGQVKATVTKLQSPQHSFSTPPTVRKGTSAKAMLGQHVCELEKKLQENQEALMAERAKEQGLEEQVSALSQQLQSAQASPDKGASEAPPTGTAPGPDKSNLKPRQSRAARTSVIVASMFALAAVGVCLALAMRSLGVLPPNLVCQCPPSAGPGELPVKTCPVGPTIAGLDQCKSQLSATEQLVADKTAEVADLRRELASREETLLRVEEAYKLQSEELKTLRVKAQRVQGGLDFDSVTCSAALQAAKREIEVREEKIASEQHAKGAVAEELKTTAERLEETRARLEEEKAVSSECERLRREQEECVHEKAAIVRMKAAVENERLAQEKQGKAEEASARAAATLAEREKDVTALKRSLEEVNGALTTCGKDGDDLREQIKRAEDQVRETEGASQVVVARIEACNLEISERNAAISGLQSEMAEAKRQCSAAVEEQRKEAAKWEARAGTKDKEIAACNQLNLEEKAQHQECKDTCLNKSEKHAYAFTKEVARANEECSDKLSRETTRRKLLGQAKDTCEAKLKDAEEGLRRWEASSDDLRSYSLKVSAELKEAEADLAAASASRALCDEYERVRMASIVTLPEQEQTCLFMPLQPKDELSELRDECSAAAGKVLKKAEGRRSFEWEGGRPNLMAGLGSMLKKASDATKTFISKVRTT